MRTSRPAPPPPRTSEAPRPPGRGGPKRAAPTPLGPVWPSLLRRRGGCGRLRTQTGRSAASWTRPGRLVVCGTFGGDPHAAHPNRPAGTHDILTLGMWTARPAPPPPRTSEAPRPPGRRGPKRAAPTPLGPIWPSPPSGGERLRTLADTDGAERSVLDPARSTCRVRYFRRRPPRRTPQPPGRHTRHTAPRDADLAPRPTSSQNLEGTPPPRAGRAEKSHAYAARPRLALPSSGGGEAADACGRRRGGAQRPGPGQVDLSVRYFRRRPPNAAHPNRPAGTHDILTLGDTKRGFGGATVMLS